MKARYSLTVLMLLFCLSFFGQQPKIVSIQGLPKKTSTQVSTNQQESILHAYSGDSRSPIPMISVHSVGDLLYRRQS